MCAVGAWIFLVSLVGLIMTREKSKKPLAQRRWALWCIAITTFLPFIGNTAGWFVTEFGRIPWTVYGLFTIAESVSPNVSVGSLLTSNIVYFVLFTTLAITLIWLIVLAPEFSRQDTALNVLKFALICSFCFSVTVLAPKLGAYAILFLPFSTNGSQYILSVGTKSGFQI